MGRHLLRLFAPGLPRSERVHLCLGKTGSLVVRPVGHAQAVDRLTKHFQRLLAQPLGNGLGWVRLLLTTDCMRSRRERERADWVSTMIRGSKQTTKAVRGSRATTAIHGSPKRARRTSWRTSMRASSRRWLFFSRSYRVPVASRICSSSRPHRAASLKSPAPRNTLQPRYSAWIRKWC